MMRKTHFDNAIIRHVTPRVRALVAALALGGAVLAPQAQADQPAALPALPIDQCINIGNHLESPNENGWGGKVLGADDFAAIRKAGFDTVRLPVRWDTHSRDEPGHAIDPAWMKRVQAMVDAALANHLKIILNSHNFELANQEPERAAPWLADVWAQIADHFKAYPKDRLWFEIENEPNGKLTAANLDATLLPSLAAIRKTNPDRAVIWGGEKWSGLDSLATIVLPNDPNIYPTFHYYEPFAFTHQGANWIHPTPPLGRSYGTEIDAQLLAHDAARLKTYQARMGKVAFLGETGANELIPVEQRAAYYRAMRATFGPMKVGMCVWAYTNTFAFRDNKTGKWLPGLLESIGLTTPKE